MSATRTKTSASAESVPQSPQAPPPAFAQPSHDFTLQAVMELQKSVGELNSTMKNMSSSLDGLKGKVDDLVGWKNKIIGGVAVIAFIGGIIGFAAGKISDFVTFKPIPATQPIQNITPPQTQQVTVPSKP